MIRLLTIFLLISKLGFSQTITINAPGKPATVSVNEPGKPASVGVNRTDPVEGLAMYSLNGSNEITASASALNFNYTDPQSYEIWFQLNSVGDAVKTLLSMYDDGTTKGTKITVNTDKYIYFYVRNGAEKLEVKSLAPVSNYILQILVPQIWYHLVITYDGTGATGVKMYVDGYLIATTTVTNTLASNPENLSTIHFGTSTMCDISTSRVFSKALSAAEVTTLYNEGQPLETTAISNKVFDLDFDGTAVPATMNLLVRNGNQSLSGNKINYNTYGRSGDTGVDIYDSPFTDARTALYYDASTNRTYLSWQQRPYLGGNRQGMITYIDHTGRYVTPSYPIGYLSPGGHDSHGQPSCIVTPDNEVLVVSEDQHLTPIYCKKTTGKDITNTTQVSTITGNNSYPGFCKLGTDLYVITRGGTGVDLMRDYISKSTNSGATWTRKVLLELNNGTGTDRAYFDVIYHPTKLILGLRLREDALEIYTTIYYIESTDGHTFTNIDGTWSKDIDVEPRINRTDLETNCLVRFSATTDVTMKGWALVDGDPIGFSNEGEAEYVYVWWNGTAWQTKPVALPDFIPGESAGNAGRGDRWFIHPYTRDHQVLFRLELRGGFDVVVKYETEDEWDTWDAGTIISDTDKDHQQLFMTYNTDADKLILAANQLTGVNGNTNIWIYEYVPILD